MNSLAGGSMKDIKRRIKSVESTGQITKAMELVASSKLRRAKERAQNATPYFTTLYETISDIAAMSTKLSSIFVQPKRVGKSLFIVIAGDRGLAGGYNSSVMKLANAKMQEKKEQGVEVQVIAIGKKAVEFYEKREAVVGGFPGIAEDLDQIRVQKISGLAIELFKQGKVDEIHLYFTQFISALSQEAMELQMLPLANLAEKSSKEKASVSCIYEPSPEAVFDAIVPMYVEGMLYGSIVESFASEQGARRTAMESASDNAKEMIDTLSLKYNRARQAAITQEISEIVSGAGAL